MSQWTHLIRFIAVEDGQIHLGQLDPKTTPDVGLATFSADTPVRAQLINGSVFDGIVTDKTMSVLHVNTHHTLETYPDVLNMKYHTPTPLCHPSHPTNSPPAPLPPLRLRSPPHPLPRPQLPRPRRRSPDAHPHRARPLHQTPDLPLRAPPIQNRRPPDRPRRLLGLRSRTHLRDRA